jgi:predicted nucleic acid-binding protein
VLTRLQHPLQLAAETAASIVHARLPSPWVTLDPNAHASVLAELATAHVSGGATYDGLIALTALDHDLELLSRDQRAARTYRALGVSFQLLAP